MVGWHELRNFVMEPVAVLVIIGILGFLARVIVKHWRIADQQNIREAVEKAVGPTEHRISTRIDGQDESIRGLGDRLVGIGDRLVRIETDQFGGNHGGLREQVDKMRIDQAQHGTELAALSGKVDTMIAMMQRGYNPTFSEGTI